MSESWLCPGVDCGHRRRTGAPAELPHDVMVCPHCGAERDAFVPLVTVATFPDPYLAHVVRARLEADGIVATLSDEHLASMTHIAGEGGVRLRVRRDQAEAAVAIMEDAAVAVDDEEEACDVDPPVRASTAPTHTVTCPRCEATTPSASAPVRFLARLRGTRRTCGRCGHAWYA